MICDLSFKAKRYPLEVLLCIMRKDLSAYPVLVQAALLEDLFRLQHACFIKAHSIDFIAHDQRCPSEL